ERECSCHGPWSKCFGVLVCRGVPPWAPLYVRMQTVADHREAPTEGRTTDYDTTSFFSRCENSETGVRMLSLSSRLPGDRLQLTLVSWGQYHRAVAGGFMRYENDCCGRTHPLPRGGTDLMTRK